MINCVFTDQNVKECDYSLVFLNHACNDDDSMNSIYETEHYVQNSLVLPCIAWNPNIQYV